MKMFFIKFIIILYNYFIEANTSFYLSMELLSVDDCLVKITHKDQVLFYLHNFDDECVYRPSDYPSPLISMIPYNFNDIIIFQFYNGKVDGYFNMTVYFNEYIIKTEHQKFWTCIDCTDENSEPHSIGNYYYNQSLNTFYFFPYSMRLNYEVWNRYYNFIFQIRDFSELNYEGNEINDIYYSFIDNVKFYILINNPEEEIDLINFNDTDNFYIKINNSLPTPYEYLRFKIYFAESHTFLGNFIGLNHSKQNIILENESFFEISENKGLRYKLSEEEKLNKSLIDLKIKIEGYTLAKPNSQIKDFYFYLYFQNNDETIIKIKDMISSGEINNVLKNEEGLLIQENNIDYSVEYLDKQNETKNISKVDLGNCEEILRIRHGIEPNIPLIILKTDIYHKGFLIPLVEYEVYNSETGELLNLSYCSEMQIRLYNPASNVEENKLFKYNSTSDYYKDLCFRYTTSKGTDIILEDRKKEFINNNLSLCEKNCTYEGYDIKQKKSICDCYIKIKMPFISEIIINKDKLLRNFMNIKVNSNFGVIYCFSLLFSKKGMIYNIGNYIMLIIIFCHIISVLFFIIKGYKIFLKKFNEVMESGNNLNKRKSKFNNMKTEGQNKKVKFENIILNKKEENKKGIEFKKSDKSIISAKKTNVKLKLKKKNSDKSITSAKKRNSKYNKNKRKSAANLNSLSSSKFNSNNNYLNLKKSKTQYDFSNINCFNDYEINNLFYKEALIYDKRTYFQYYASLLRRKHLLLFAFYTKNDYNSREIKICLFLFSFSLLYTVNAFFFIDSTMHKIYVDEGSYNFIYQIPFILYSTIIDNVACIIIKLLSLTETEIVEIKNSKNNKKKKGLQRLKFIKIKMIIFFTLCFLLEILFWYYLSCFCAVYINTQKHLISDTLISLGLSFIYPLIINLIPGLFRNHALKNPKVNHEKIYNFSKFLQLI